ncbi:Uncharacterised protein [Mycobacterium tuberculosis]|nr:Uncharacterised protein [Mycobacterium tuberculosis]
MASSPCHPPTAKRCVQIFVKTAIIPSNTATAAASSMARLRPMARRAAPTQTISGGTVIRNANVHAGIGGRLWPSPGCPTSTNTASAAVNSAAQPHCARLTRCRRTCALNGRANSNDDTSKGWTSSNEPWASART